MKTLKSLFPAAILSILSMTLVVGCQSNHPLSSNKIVTPGAGMKVATDEELSADAHRQVTELKGTLSPEERSVLLEAAGAEKPINTSPEKPIVR